jgi:tRNA (cytidine/uridine-2'-O-)-methyltransferase
MLHLALHEPEIAPNTGNIARTCVATGTRLHLIGRLGFRLDDRSLRRAGLDYWDRVDFARHADWEAFVERSGAGRLWLFSAHGRRAYTEIAYAHGDGLVFGGETKGLPPYLLERYAENVVTIPMLPGGVRSLNLATAAGIALYEALRQLGWPPA